jgi:hypothetical protein
MPDFCEAESNVVPTPQKKRPLARTFRRGSSVGKGLENDEGDHEQADCVADRVKRDQCGSKYSGVLHGGSPDMRVFFVFVFLFYKN